MTLEGARLLELHSSLSVASGMSHHEHSKTAVSYSSKFLTKQEQIEMWQLLLVRNLRIVETCAFIVR